MSTVVNKVNFVDIRFILACKKNCLPESVLQMSCQLRWTAPYQVVHWIVGEESL